MALSCLRTLWRAAGRIARGGKTDLRMLRALARDESAAVGPMVAVLGVSLLAAAGLALDVGVYYVGNRNLRAATEAAALAAAIDPYNAQARAEAYMARNGYSADVVQSVQIGRYCADINLPSGQRFDPTLSLCPGNGLATAVRISTEKPSRRFLTGVLGGDSVIPDLAATATAARIDEAGIAITSGIITVTNSLVNAVNDLLGSLIGIQLQLSTSDIEALMRGEVDAGKFFDGLAAKAGYTGTYEGLTQGSYGMRDIANAAADATSNPLTAASLRTFASQTSNSYQVPLSNLFGLGVWKNMPVGEADAQPALRAGMNAYQLVTFAVQAGNATLDLSNTVSLAVPGSTMVVAAMARGPVERPYFSFGPAGETVAGTSALRLQLRLGLGDITLLGLPVSVNSIPLMIEVAAARADLSAIDCADTAELARDTRATVTAQSGLVNAYIGEVPADAMTRPMPTSASEVQPARIVNLLNLITVDAKAIAQPVLGNSGALVFGPNGNGTIGTPDAPGTPASIGNGSQAGALIGSLTGSLTGPDGLDVKLFGSLCLPLVCATNKSLVRNTLLPALVTPIGGLVGTAADPLLDNLLAALGIQLGHATVWATGARCGVPVLV